ncbi:MAG TPA: hypothetical protein VK864_14140 [Longimicrobiales bacterium]|nr:hypothetical protein [Longimicrobiales bacterium]
MPAGILDQIIIGVSRFVQENVIDQYRLWRARIHGIEVTQSIQYYRSAEHLTDAADRLPDNSVQLVAYKAAWVRVYVRSGLFSSVNVTGTLEVARRNRVMTYDVVGTYTPQGVATVTAEQTVAYNTERNGLNRTLNFVIPAHEFHGTLRLTARLADMPGAQSQVVVSARLLQTLRIRAVLVAYNGPSSANPPAPGQPPITQLTLAAPTLADLQNTAGMALATMPVQATGSFASCGTLNWATPLDDMRTAAGACSTNWDTLLNWLALLQDNDGNRADVVYYGLLPAGIPLGVPGCGENGLGSAAVGDQLNLLHEIGHGYDFQHTPCGPAGATDPNYPTYEPYPSASIGEFGLDIRNGTIYDPSVARDYMSYCNPRWMSLYQHNRLVQHPRLVPRWLSERSIFDDYPQQRPFDLEHLWWPDPPWLPDEVLEHRMSAVISIVGRVPEIGEIQIESVARIRAAAPPTGTPTRWIAQLVDEAGNPLARAPLVRLQHHGGCDCGCGGRHDQDTDEPPFVFKAYVPDVAPGAALRIVSPEKEIWTRHAPARPPRFVRARAKATAEQLTLIWHTESEGTVDVWAQWTSDRGEHWHGLAIGLKGSEAVLPLTGLPAGAVQLRLLAHDGFFTAESEMISLELPERAPEIAILHPRNGQTLRIGQPFQVAGNATDTAGNPLPNERLRWSLNGSVIGHGRELWLSQSHEGRHELTLEVDWTHGTARSMVNFSTA